MNARRWFAGRSRSGVVVAALVLGIAMMLGAGVAQAYCDKGKRIKHSRAECVDAWWSDRGLYVKIGAQNRCSDIGPAVVKFDAIAEKDYTWTLRDAKKKRLRTARRIRGAYCCPDLGVCNRSDAAKRQACLERFNVNRDGSRCREVSVGVHDGKCTFSAKCWYRKGHHFWARVRVSPQDVYRIRVCSKRKLSIHC